MASDHFLVSVVITPDDFFKECGPLGASLRQSFLKWSNLEEVINLITEQVNWKNTLLDVRSLPLGKGNSRYSVASFCLF